MANCQALHVVTQGARPGLLRSHLLGQESARLQPPLEQELEVFLAQHLQVLQVQADVFRGLGHGGKRSALLAVKRELVVARERQHWIWRVHKGDDGGRLEQECHAVFVALAVALALLMAWSAPPAPTARARRPGAWREVYAVAHAESRTSLRGRTSGWKMSTFRIWSGSSEKTWRPSSSLGSS